MRKRESLSRQFNFIICIWSPGRNTILFYQSLTIVISPLLRMVILCMRKVDFLAEKKPHQSIVQTFVGNVEVGCDCLTSLNGWYGVLNLILPQVHFIERNNQNDLSDKSKSSGPIWSRYNYCQLKEECEDRKSVYLVGYQILTFNVRNSHNSNYGNFTNQHLSSVLLIRVNIVISQNHSYSILGI